jgi:hypothetical protein
MSDSAKPPPDLPSIYDGPFRVWDVPSAKTQPHMLGVWLVDAPGAHAFWRCWQIYLVHLRDDENLRPARKQFPEATHEVISFALDPSTEPDPRHAETFVRLSPIDFAVQFSAKSDETARRVMDALLKAVSDGRVSPDTDWRRFWEETLKGTAECLDSGQHPLS